MKDSLSMKCTMAIQGTRCLGLALLLFGQMFCRSFTDKEKFISDRQYHYQSRIDLCLQHNPSFQKQWYIHGGNSRTNHLNVLPIWRANITGDDIRIGVVDVGINLRPDLNYIHYLDLNRWGATAYKARHGTEVAGVIGAKWMSSGHICGNFPVGIAYNSYVIDLRALSDDVTDDVDYSTLVNRLDGIHIYSCSFSNYRTGTTTFQLPETALQNLKTGTERGRVGKGAVYVWSTGNGGGNRFDRDSCAYDGYVNNPYVIAVGGISHDLQPLSYGEECSAMFVSAFTNDFRREPGMYGIVTLYGAHNITESFGEMSAAVPMVSAAIALVIQATSNRLQYRDIMHLLVHTSRSKGYLPDDVYQRYFQKNAANIPFSSKFGFGVLDVNALVVRSQTWVNVPKLRTYSMTQTPNDEGLDKNRNTFERRYSYGCQGQTSDSITSLEHVGISLSYTARLAGQIQWHLISPGGTQSEILPGRYLDYHITIDITVVSVQFWDENPCGKWTLRANITDDGHYGTLHGWNLTLHGFTRHTSTSPPTTKPNIQIGYWAHGLWGRK